MRKLVAGLFTAGMIWIVGFILVWLVAMPGRRESPISWRPSKEARLALAELLKTGRRRNEILNGLVISAALTGEVDRPQRRVHTPDDAGSIPAAATKPRGSATTGPDELREGSVSVKRTLGGVKRVQAIPKPGWKK